MTAFGQGLVILSGGIDLSVPATIAVAAFTTGYLSDHGLPELLAILLAILIASTIGLVNGIIVARSTFPPFIVTLATSTVAAALLLGFSAGAPGQKAPSNLLGVFASGNDVLGIPAAVFLFLIAAGLGWYVQNRTRLGRRTYAVGNSPVASRIAGINVPLNIFQVYWVASLFYAVAGVLLMGYGSGSDLNIGSPWLLPSIAAVVIGGSSIAGGSGRYSGTIGAAVLLTMLSIGISALGLSEGLKQVLYGAVILVALLLSRFARARV
ncbi:ABC transporter permease [Rhodococcus sp. Leaf278]|nr:ABC transporter permease [Rhodococcus sp. Leaf278]